MIKSLFGFLLVSLLTFGQETLIIAIDEWPPFRIFEGDKIIGLDIYLWTEISKRLGVKVKFERYPWARALKKMEDGEVDAMGGLAKTIEREAFIKYSSAPYYTCTTRFYLQKGKGNSLSTYENLYKFNSIGVVIGSFYYEPFNSDKKIKKNPVATEEQLLKLLESKRIDVIIGTECQVDYELKKMNLSNKFDKSTYKPDNKVELFLGISKKSKYANKVDEINKILLELIKEGKINEFAKRYY